MISTAIINNSYKSLTNVVAISNQTIKAIAINSTIDSIKDIYDGQPIPVDSNGRIRTDLHEGTKQEEKEGRAYLEHNDNLPKAQYNSLQSNDKDAYNQYIKDRDTYNKELNDDKNHFDDYKKILDEYNKLTNNGNKYSEDVVVGPPCWWHGYNGWQSKENINKVWIASVGFISDTPDEDGGYLDVEPAYTLRHNGITGQNSLQYGIGLDYSGMPDGSSRCSNYIDKSGVLTIIPPKGYKFNVEASKKTEMINYKYNGKPLVVSFTPDKIVFDFQVYADAGKQYIGPASTPIDGHSGYYQMTNGHFFQLVVTPIDKESTPVQSVPKDADYYQDTIDWESYIWPGGTSNFGKGDRRPGIIDRQILKMPLNGKDPKKMSNAERTYVVVAPAGWQFQNVRETKEYPAQWAPFEFNDVHDSYDSDWKQGDHLTRATIDDGTTNSLYATPDQAHIGFFDFNREFQGFKDSYKEAHDRLWLMPDQTWNGIKGQQHDKVFAEPIADTGASIDAKNMTVKLGDKTDFSKVNATDWMGKPTTAKLVKGSIDVNKPGKYSLTYENTNSFGIKSDKTILITVQSNQQDITKLPNEFNQNEAKLVATYPWDFNFNGKKINFNENGIQQLPDGSFIMSGNTQDPTDKSNSRDQDLILSHLTKDFKPIDYMIISHGGHGSVVGALQNKNGSISIYEMINDRSKKNGNDRIVEFTYQPNKTLANNDSSIKVIGTPANSTIPYDGGATVSQDGKEIAFMPTDDIWGQANAKIYVYGLQDNKLSDKPIQVIDVNSVKPGIDKSKGIIQSYTFSNDGKKLFLTFGGANDPHKTDAMKNDPRDIVTVDISSGKATNNDLIDFANNKAYGITSVSDAEPEGITESIDGKGAYLTVGTWQKGIKYDSSSAVNTPGKIFFIPFNWTDDKHVSSSSMSSHNDKHVSSSSMNSHNDNKHVTNSSMSSHNDKHVSSSSMNSHNDKHLTNSSMNSHNDKHLTNSSMNSHNDKHLTNSSMSSYNDNKHVDNSSMSSYNDNKHVTSSSMSSYNDNKHVDNSSMSSHNDNKHVDNSSMSSHNDNKHVTSSSMSSHNGNKHVTSSSMSSHNGNKHVTSSSMSSHNDNKHVTSSSMSSHNDNKHVTSSSMSSYNNNKHVDSSSDKIKFAQTNGTKQVSHSWLYNLIYDKLPNWLRHFE